MPSGVPPVDAAADGGDAGRPDGADGSSVDGAAGDAGGDTALQDSDLDAPEERAAEQDADVDSEAESGNDACVPTGVAVCDGVDNDCNGEADDGDAGGGDECTTSLPGECARGTVHCQAGAIVCVPQVQPSAEVCDGLDNDCDGTADQGDPGAGAACNTSNL